MPNAERRRKATGQAIRRSGVRRQASGFGGSGLGFRKSVRKRKTLDSLTVAVRARIQARVLRFEMGNLGDHKSVGSGVWEARVMFGPGYRIYFGKDGDSVIVLLVGGDKGSQSKDVSRAQELWPII